MQQSDIIKNLSAEVKEIKEEQQTAKAEAAIIKAELKQVYEQLEAITRSQAINILINNSPSPSYAELACTPLIS
jgi:predicted secreted protein